MPRLKTPSTPSSKQSGASIIQKFIHDQLSVWSLASTNFRALKSVKIRELAVSGLNCVLQYNPKRVISSTANTDPQAIAARACFLCEQNRPQEQFHISFEGRKGRLYRIQLNPYPIFPKHLVIVRNEHLPQAIWHHFPDMLDFTRAYPDYIVFYNGPASGASAPDHLHFQAASRGHMPLERAIDAFLDSPGEPLASVKDATLYRYPHFVGGVFALKATTSKSLAKLFYRLLDCTDRLEAESEPKFNLYTYVKGSEYRTFVVMRSAKRSHHFYSSGPDHLTISPGAADMAGVFVAPFREDYDKATPALMEEMLSEVTISRNEQDMIEWRLKRSQKSIEVGILRSEEISFEIISDGAGPQKVSYCDGKIAYNGMLYDELYFDSMTLSTQFAESSFILHDLYSGGDSRQQQSCELKFAGALKFVVDAQSIRAINIIGEEDYLLSVLSSEKEADSSLEELKALAIATRSWLEARLEERSSGVNPLHALYDVCADAHCRSYRGLSIAVGEAVRRAVDQTWGQVVAAEGVD